MVAGTCKLSNVRSDQGRAYLVFYKNNRAIFPGKNMEIALSSKTKTKQNKKTKTTIIKNKKTLSQISSS